MKYFLLIMALSTCAAEPWDTCQPEDVGLSKTRLYEMQAIVWGRGCVVRNGRMAWTWGDIKESSDVASAFKPLLSTLLLIAVQEGKLASVDARVADVEPRLNGAITWRHLASQLSGYGLEEPAGKAYAYNDFALALYYDLLMRKVFKEAADVVLQTRLAEPLGFEDEIPLRRSGPRIVRAGWRFRCATLRGLACWCCGMANGKTNKLCAPTCFRWR